MTLSLIRQIEVPTCEVCKRHCRETFELRDPETLTPRKVGECHALLLAVRLLQAQYERAAQKALRSMGCLPHVPEEDANDALLVLSVFSARFEQGLYRREA